MADGVLLEKAGLPTVSICTEPFRVTGEAMAGAYGAEWFDFVTVPHPLASLGREEIRERVAAAIPDILRILGVAEQAGDVEEGDR